MLHIVTIKSVIVHGRRGGEKKEGKGEGVVAPLFLPIQAYQDSSWKAWLAGHRTVFVIRSRDIAARSLSVSFREFKSSFILIKGIFLNLVPWYTIPRLSNEHLLWTTILFGSNFWIKFLMRKFLKMAFSCRFSE